MLDEKNLFKDIFETVWDAARSGNIERLKQKIGMNSQDTKAFTADSATPWLGNTPLHLAVRFKQLKAIKVLMWELNANAKLENKAKNSALDHCNKFIKDEATRTTAMGLLNKMHQNTTVPKNLDAKRAAARKRQAEFDELNGLRTTLRSAIEARGYDIKKMFEMFDTDGSGSFDQTEFEAAFACLQIKFKVADLRKLITLSDKNNDGQIDFDEFHSMLYAEDENEDEDGGFEPDSDSG